jgi:hypothetical protein
VVHGAMTVSFPPGSGFQPYSFRAVDVEHPVRKVFGYTWVVAPPFQVIDLSIQTQDFPDPVAHLLPKILLANDTDPTEGDPEEILSVAAIEEARQEGLLLGEMLDRLAPGYLYRFAPDFPACRFKRDETWFKFVPLQIVTTENSLEQFKGFMSQGRLAIQIYEQQIKPRVLKE